MCDFVEMEHLQNLNKLIRTLKVGRGGIERNLIWEVGGEGGDKNKSKMLSETLKHHCWERIQIHEAFSPGWERNLERPKVTNLFILFRL